MPLEQIERECKHQALPAHAPEQGGARRHEEVPYTLVHGCEKVSTPDIERVFLEGP